MKQAKAHHFVPVAHLARFSASPESVPVRDRVVHVYDKRAGRFRRAKVRNVAYENDLYTIRTPDLSDIEPEIAQLIGAVFDPAHKDAEIEELKIGMEANGLAAMREIEAWEIGPRRAPDDLKAALVSYVGLLLAQHPTMMAARASVIRQKFWVSAGPRFGATPPSLRAVFDEFSSGVGVLAVVMDAFAAALELNYLAWKIIRWPDEPHLVLGDVGVAAWYPPYRLGVGGPWDADAMFLLPISPTTLLMMGGLAPGTCVVEARRGAEASAEIAAYNYVSWARARSEVYGGHFEDLERTLAMIGHLDPRADNSTQLEVRGSVLPDYIVADDGQLEIVQPPDPSAEETDTRFAARFQIR